MSLIDQYSPVHRYFSPTAHALVTLTAEGVTLNRRIGDDDWIIRARKKEAFSYDEWIATKRRDIAELPAWALDIQDLPSFEDLEEWLSDGLCQTRPATTLNRTAKGRTAYRPGCGSSA